VTHADRLRAGERLIGTVLSIGDPVLAELACAPFDFVWLDMEHSPVGVGDVARLAVAARSAGCAALARLPGAAAPRLTAVLDAGVDGIVVPRVRGAVEAAAVAAALRYPPDGTRGFAHRRASGYGRLGAPAGVPVCTVQIESAAAVASAEEIAAVPGVDVLVVGIADLALALGVPPQLDEPALAGAVATVRQAAERAGVAWGIAGGGDVREFAGSGAPFLVYSADVRLYAAAVDRVAAELRS
jgi:4-hydroxy-2-oxoheptanedioate aldolase